MVEHLHARGGRREVGRDQRARDEVVVVREGDDGGGGHVLGPEHELVPEELWLVDGVGGWVGLRKRVSFFLKLFSAKKKKRGKKSKKSFQKRKRTLLQNVSAIVKSLENRNLATFRAPAAPPARAAAIDGIL